MEKDLKQKMIAEINELWATRVPLIEQMYPAIRESYVTPYDWPEMDTLRHEVSICLIFGLHQAAITLTNHLLESLLKFALSYKDALQKMGKSQESNSLPNVLSPLKSSFEHHDNKDLSQTIDQSCSAGLITKEQKKDLHRFREAFRNAYGHAEKRKIHKDSSVPVQFVQIRDEANFRVNPEELVKILDMPFAHGFVQNLHAKANAAPYFLYIDALVREMKPKVFPGPTAQNSSPQS